MKQISVLILLLSVVLVSCSEDDSGMNQPPQITLSEATDICRTSATLSSNISNAEGRSLKEYGFIYSTTSDFANMPLDDIRKSSACIVTKIYEPIISGDMTQGITALTSNTTYYYCAYVSSGYSIERSEVKSFTTAAETDPVFRTWSPLCFENSCTLSFELLDIGGEDKIRLLEVLYQIADTIKKYPDDKSRWEKIDVNDNGQSYNVILNNLEPFATYSYCIHLITDKGREWFSDIDNFSTLIIMEPLAPTEKNVIFYANVFPNQKDFSLYEKNGTLYAHKEIFYVDLSFRVQPEVSGSLKETGLFYCHNGIPTERSSRISDNNCNFGPVCFEDFIPYGEYVARPYVVFDDTYILSDETYTIYSRADVEVLECTYENLSSTSVIVESALEVDEIENFKEQIMTVWEYGFCYVEGSDAPGINDETFTITHGKQFHVTLYGLKPDTDYTICAYARPKYGYGITYDYVSPHQQGDTNIIYSLPIRIHTPAKAPSSVNKRSSRK